MLLAYQNSIEKLLNKLDDTPGLCRPSPNTVFQGNYVSIVFYILFSFIIFQYSQQKGSMFLNS